MMPSLYPNRLAKIIDMIKDSSTILFSVMKCNENDFEILIILVSEK